MSSNNKKAFDLDVTKNINKHIDYKLIKTAEDLSLKSRKFGHNPDPQYSLNTPFSRKFFSSLNK
jgi:hypothetical protein